LDGSLRLELVIFDMDQVLCRYDRPLRLRRLAALSTLTAEEIFAAIWESGFEAGSEAGAMDADAYLAGFGERISYPLNRSQWIEARRIAMTPSRDVLTLVAAIKRSVRVAMLTNNGFLTKETIGQLFPELIPLFGSNLLFSAEFGARKPEPEVYRRFLDKFGIAPNTALMIDDDPINIAGAERAGLEGHVFNGSAALAAHLASFGIDAAR
jgi:glucose-1-phosphatase